MIKDIRFTKEDWRLFWGCALASVFLYFAKIVNELPNPDALWQGMAYKEGWRWEVGLGRYLIGLFQELRRAVIVPELVSLVSLLLLAIVCVCVVKIFNVTDGLARVCVCGLIVLSPTVGSTLTYYYCSDMYFLSYVLSVAAVLFAIKSRTYIGWVAYVVAICFSAAIYQAYLGITITLCYIYIFYLLLDREYSVQKIIKLVVRLFLGGCCGIFLYLISNRLVQGILKVEAVSDRGFASMGNISFGNFPGLIKDAYSGFFEYFLDSTMINNFWGGRYKINCIFGVCAMAVLIIVLCRAKVALYRKIVAIIGILMLPIPIMSIMIMAPEVSVYDSTGVLMLPTMNYVYIGFCVMAVKYSELFDVKLRRALKSILVCCCGLVCYMLCVLELSGQAYMKHYMNKTQAVAYSMVEQIETVVDNSEDYTVCFIGEMENGNYPEVYESLRNSVHWTTAYHKTMWTSFQGRQGGWISYIAHYMGKTYRSCSQADYDRIVQSAEYARMQNFPDELGIMVIDDIIVIKLSDV